MPWKKWAYKPVNLGADTEADEKDQIQETTTPLAPLTVTPARPTFHDSLRTATSSAGGLFPLAATAAAVLFFALFLFMPRPWLLSDHPQQIAYYTCGNSTQDATAAGCRFDVMSYTWVHPNCFDQELMYDFLAESDWQWYEDEDSDESLGLDDVARGQHEYVFVTWKYYMTHCTYSTFFLPLPESIMNNLPLPPFFFLLRNWR